MNPSTVNGPEFVVDQTENESDCCNPKNVENPSDDVCHTSDNQCSSSGLLIDSLGASDKRNCDISNHRCSTCGVRFLTKSLLAKHEAKHLSTDLNNRRTTSEGTISSLPEKCPCSKVGTDNMRCACSNLPAYRDVSSPNTLKRPRNRSGTIVSRDKLRKIAPKPDESGVKSIYKAQSDHGPIPSWRKLLDLNTRKACVLGMDKIDYEQMRECGQCSKPFYPSHSKSFAQRETFSYKYNSKYISRQSRSTAKHSNDRCDSLCFKCNSCDFSLSMDEYESKLSDDKEQLLDPFAPMMKDEVLSDGEEGLLDLYSNEEEDQSMKEVEISATPLESTSPEIRTRIKQEPQDFNDDEIRRSTAFNNQSSVDELPGSTNVGRQVEESRACPDLTCVKLEPLDPSEVSLLMECDDIKTEPDLSVDEVRPEDEHVGTRSKSVRKLATPVPDSGKEPVVTLKSPTLTPCLSPSQFRFVPTDVCRTETTRTFPSLHLAPIPNPNSRQTSTSQPSIRGKPSSATQFAFSVQASGSQPYQSFSSLKLVPVPFQTSKLKLPAQSTVSVQSSTIKPSVSQPTPAIQPLKLLSSPTQPVTLQSADTQPSPAIQPLKLQPAVTQPVRLKPYGAQPFPAIQPLKLLSSLTQPFKLQRTWTQPSPTIQPLKLQSAVTQPIKLKPFVAQPSPAIQPLKLLSSLTQPFKLQPTGTQPSPAIQPFKSQPAVTQPSPAIQPLKLLSSLTQPVRLKPSMTQPSPAIQPLKLRPSVTQPPRPQPLIFRPVMIPQSVAGPRMVPLSSIQHSGIQPSSLRPTVMRQLLTQPQTSQPILVQTSKTQDYMVASNGLSNSQTMNEISLRSETKSEALSEDSKELTVVDVRSVSELLPASSGTVQSVERADNGNRLDSIRLKTRRSARTMRRAGSGKLRNGYRSLSLKRLLPKTSGEPIIKRSSHRLIKKRSPVAVTPVTSFVQNSMMTSLLPQTVSRRFVSILKTEVPITSSHDCKPVSDSEAYNVETLLKQKSGIPARFDATMPTPYVHLRRILSKQEQSPNKIQSTVSQHLIPSSEYGMKIIGNKRRKIQPKPPELRSTELKSADSLVTLAGESRDISSSGEEHSSAKIRIPRLLNRIGKFRNKYSCDRCETNFGSTLSLSRHKRILCPKLKGDATVEN